MTTHLPPARCSGCPHVTAYPGCAWCPRESGPVPVSVVLDGDLAAWLDELRREGESRGSVIRRVLTERKENL